MPLLVADSEWTIHQQGVLDVYTSYFSICDMYQVVSPESTVPKD